MPNPDNEPKLPKNQSAISTNGVVSRDWYRFFLNLVNKVNEGGGGNGTGTVTSVAVSGGTTGLTTSGGPITTNGTITLSGTVNVANGGTGLTSTPTNGQIDIGNGTGFTRTTLTAGSGVSITNGAGSITISSSGGGGSVTAVTGTTPISSSGGTTPNISLDANYGDTLNPYASKTANYILAAPDGSAGAPTFRAVVAADIPTLNQNTTGTAGSVANALTAGTGISYSSGTTYDGAAAITINNAAPDQTVVLTAGAGISTSGTYPNFTITNTSPSLGGDVVGPSSATDNAIARYDATTGKLIQNSSVLISDTGNVTGVNDLTAESLTVNNNATLGFSNTDTLDVRSRIVSDLEPNVDNAKDIGTSGRNWRDGFFGRNLSTVNFEVTGTTSFDGQQGTSGQVLTSAGTGNTPTWTTPTVGTVTSVGGTGTVNGITLTGTVTSSGNLTLGGTLSGVDLTSQVTGTLPVTNGGTGQTSYTDGQLLIGNSTGNTLTKSTLTAGTGISITNGGGSITINATNAGAVTSVTGTSPVVSSGGATPDISLASGYGDTQNPYASKTANYFLAAPNGTAGVPTFRAVVPADIPTLNQNTTGQAGSVANALTAGTGISYSSGTTYDGAAAITINNSAPMVYPGAGIPNSTGTAWGASYTTTGSGTVLVLATSPSLTTPILGVPQSGDFSTGTFTWPTFNQNTTGTADNVTGVVAIANGGTGQTTATAAFDALSPTTTKGDLIVSNGTDNVRQAVGTDTYVLTADSTTATGIKWAASSGSGATITNDTTTATNLYPTFAAATSGSLTTIYTGDTKLLYKPSTGELTSSEVVASNGIFVNSQTISANYTIAAGNSGVSAGVITVASGITVTLSSGSRWVVV